MFKYLVKRSRSPLIVNKHYNSSFARQSVVCDYKCHASDFPEDNARSTCTHTHLMYVWIFLWPTLVEKKKKLLTLSLRGRNLRYVSDWRVSNLTLRVNKLLYLSFQATRCNVHLWTERIRAKFWDIILTRYHGTPSTSTLSAWYVSKKFFNSHTFKNSDIKIQIFLVIDL